MSESARVSMIMMLGAGGLVTGGMVRYTWERICIWRRLDLHEYAGDFRRSVRKADPAMPILLIICDGTRSGMCAISGAATNDVPICRTANATISAGELVANAM